MSIKNKLWEAAGNPIEALGNKITADDRHYAKTRIFVNGALQKLNSDYVIEYSRVTFINPPPHRARVEIIAPDGTTEVIYAQSNSN